MLPKFLSDSTPIGPKRIWRQVQLARDLLIEQPTSGEVDDFQFPS